MTEELSFIDEDGMHYPLEKIPEGHPEWTTLDGVYFTELVDNPFIICPDGRVRQADGFDHGGEWYFLEYNTSHCGCCYDSLLVTANFWEVFSTEEIAEKFKIDGRIE